MEKQTPVGFVLVVFIFLVSGLLSAEESPHQLAFYDQVTAIEREAGGRLGIAALNTGTGEFLEYRSDKRFAMCSTFKLLLVSAVLSMVESHPDLLSQVVPFESADLVTYSPVTTAHIAEATLTVEELCSATIIESDNTAANLLIEMIGGPSGLTAFARSLGDMQTRLDRYEPSLNSNVHGDERDTTTPAAMVHSMQEILVGDILTPSSRELLLTWLSKTVTGRERIRAGVDRSWRVGTKSGSGERGATNDIGIIWPPEGDPFVVAVYFSESRRPRHERDEVIAEVARLAIGMLCVP
jgi:beta-lactamase class A